MRLIYPVIYSVQSTGTGSIWWGVPRFLLSSCWRCSGNASGCQGMSGM